MNPEQHPKSPYPRCNTCGYELTGFSVEGVCPECGTKIWNPHTMQPTSGYAITSLVLGCLSIVSCATIGPVAFVFGLPGVIFGHMSTAQLRRGTRGGATKGLAIAGLVLSYIGLSVAIIFLLFFLLMFGGFMASGAAGAANGGGFTPMPAGP